MAIFENVIHACVNHVCILNCLTVANGDVIGSQVIVPLLNTVSFKLETEILLTDYYTLL